MFINNLNGQRDKLEDRSRKMSTHLSYDCVDGSDKISAEWKKVEEW